MIFTCSSKSVFHFQPMQIEKSKIKIHPVGKNEIPILVRYRLRYLTELQGKSSTLNEDKLKQELQSYFEKKLEENLFFAFVAKWGEVILGFGAMIIKEIPGDYSRSTYLEGDILNMYTVPEARKKGISTAILEMLVEEAKRKNISKIALHASKDGESMYRNFGFSDPAYPYLEMVLNTNNFSH